MSILKTDFLAEGHKLGLKDATSSNKPNKKGVNYHWEMLKKGFRIINHNEAMKTFSHGYETGFTDGLRKREGLYGNNSSENKNSNINNSKSMSSNPDSLRKQVELLNSFDNFLSNIQGNLNEVNRIYGFLIEELYNAGLVEEYAKKLKMENHTNFNDKIGKVNRWISEIDKKYTKQVIGQVKEAMK